MEQLTLFDSVRCIVHEADYWVVWLRLHGEQAWNAREAVSASGAIVTADANFTPAWVRRELVPLLLDRARVAHLAAGMASTGVRDGADRMVALIREALSAASTNVSS